MCVRERREKEGKEVMHRYIPNWDFSKGSNCGCAPSTRSTAVIFSVFLNRAKTSR